MGTQTQTQTQTWTTGVTTIALLVLRTGELKMALTFLCAFFFFHPDFILCIMGKCVYSTEWPKQYSWVKEMNNKHKAHCLPCNKDTDVAQMGESALRSQVKGEGHKKQEKVMS